MRAYDLKNSILQLAISGKLVSQDPNDEPAALLFDKIQAERKRLIADGKIRVPKSAAKPAPINPTAAPFQIPDNWIWVKLGDIVSITTGDKDANYADNNGEYDFFTCAAIPMKSKNFSFVGESLILPGNGANIGMCIYYNGKFEAYQRTYILQGFLSGYLKYVQQVMNLSWGKYNQDKMFGSAIPYIKFDNLYSFPIPFPPLPEQRRIMEKIEELSPLVEKYGAVAEELARLISAV